MDTLLGFIIIIMLLYIIDMLKKGKDNVSDKEKKFSYADILPQYKNKKCEITVKKPMPSIDIMFNVQGILLEWDDVWVVMKVQNKKSSSQKIFRVDNIASIKEILE